MRRYGGGKRFLCRIILLYEPALKLPDQNQKTIVQIRCDVYVQGMKGLTYYFPYILDGYSMI